MPVHGSLRWRHPSSVPPNPDGVYRFTLTRSDLLRFNPKLKPGEVQGSLSGQIHVLPENIATTTVYLRHGEFYFIKQAGHPLTIAIMAGIYQGNGHYVTFTVQRRGFDPAFSEPKARWRFDGRALHFKLSGCAKLNQTDCAIQRAVFEAHPWVKVADLP